MRHPLELIQNVYLTAETYCIKLWLNKDNPVWRLAAAEGGWCCLRRMCCSTGLFFEIFIIGNKHVHTSQVERDKQRKLLREKRKWNKAKLERNEVRPSSLFTSHSGFNNWRISLFMLPLSKNAQVSDFIQTSWLSFWGIHRLVSSKPSKGLSLSSLGTSKN